MKKYAVIVAGGSGRRMGNVVPKQFLLLHGKPLMYYSIKAFLDAFDDINIILVVPANHVQSGEELITEMKVEKKVRVTIGGSSRFDSVKNGLNLIHEASVVFVHDAVRCLVTQALLRNCYEQAIEKGSAIPAVAATDSIRIEENGKHSIINRNQVRIIQTPQTFLSEILLAAFEQTYQDAFTDEASVVEAAGTEVFLIEGEHQNIKITRPIDLFIAEKILEERALFKQQ